MEKIKIIIISIVSALMNFMGILAIPVFLLVLCNVIDYITGIAAARYRTEGISSYKGIKGIMKKVCMWLLIVVGAVVDILLGYAAQYTGLAISLPFLVAMVVAVWLLINEIISILENMTDIGIKMPPFLAPLIRNMQKQVENSVSTEEKKEEGERTHDTARGL